MNIIHRSNYQKISEHVLSNNVCDLLKDLRDISVFMFIMHIKNINFYEHISNDT